MSRVSRLDRRALFASGAAAALLAVTGVSAQGAPQRGGRLRLAVSGGSRADGWATDGGLFMQVARQGLVFDGLTEIAADGTLRGELATGWQSSADARVWRFDLRTGVRFHDGAPLTARDVAASLADLGEVTMAGPRAVTVALDAPDPQLPFRLAGDAHVIRPAHAPQEGIGTGLYRVRDFRPGQRLVTERVASHYKDGRAGWFDEVELVSITAEPVRLQAVREYLVDAADVASAGLEVTADMDFQPDGTAPQQVVSRAVAQPVRIGRRLPLDDLRAAERWWFA